MSSDGAERDEREPTRRPLTDRRAVLKAAGTAGVFGLTGAAGCLSELGAGAGTVNYGILNPMTGPYSGLAQEQRRGARLAVQQINDSEEYDLEIDASYADTQADPETGRQQARRLIEQEGADFLMGAISSSVALSLNSLALDEEVIYNPGAAAIPITGSECNEYVFRAETNTAQIAEACAEWTIENLGSDVWFHIADYAYGQSVYEEWRSRMGASDAEFNEVNQSAAELGETNFDPFISDIANSDADVVVVGSTGGDMVGFLTQAAAQGLQDEMDIMTTTGSFQVVRAGVGADIAGVYSGTRYVPTITDGDNRAFVESFSAERDTNPDNFARVAYDSIRMTANGIREAGTSDPTEVNDTLAGLEMTTLLGNNRFRECDQQAMNPVWVGQCGEPDGGGLPTVDLIEKQEGTDAIPACEDTACDMG